MNAYQTLINKLTTWQRWSRIVQAANWGLRGLLIGGSISTLALSYFLLQNQLIRSEFLSWLLVGGGLGTFSAILIALLRPISIHKTARNFDLVFGLKERTSTAIELQQNNYPATLAWQEEQLKDAVLTIENTNPKSNLPWKYHWGEIVGVALLSITVSLMWFYGESHFEQAEQAKQQEQIIEEQIEEIEAVIEEIVQLEQLTDEEKATLLEPLEESIEALHEADTLEEAVSIMHDAESALESLSKPGEKLIEDLKNVGDQLSEQTDSPLEDFGNNLSQGELQKASDALEDMELSEMSDDDRQELANQFSKMAEALAESNPALAKQFQQAAEALQSGDMESAQEALQALSQALEQEMDSMEFSQAASDASELLSQSQLQAALQAAGAGGQNGDAQPGIGQSFSGNGNSNSGAGRGEFTEEATGGKEVGLQPIDQNNGPGDGGETGYDSIYAPEHLGGDDNNYSSQPGSEAPGETKIGETNSDFEDENSSSVPYTDVYNDYEAEVQSALESGYIPPALRPLVREYFDALAPK